MNLKSLSNAVTSKVGRRVLVAQKHSPSLLFGAGVVGFVATAVLAARATLKLEEVLDEVNKNKELAEQALSISAEQENKKYSEMDYKRDLVLIQLRGVTKLAKLYGPALIVGVLSVAALTGSHKILTRRNAALTAAYAVVEKGFNEYRKRVVAEFGEEKEQELRYGIVGTTEVSQTNLDGTHESKTIKLLNGKNASMYARFFDETNKNWKREHAYNQMFIQCQQNYANQLLNSRGHLFLNEVYEMLGFERTSEGQIVGWVLNGDGDNYVDFGVCDGDNYMGKEFVNGYERSVLLDFNVDGVVYDKI